LILADELALWGLITAAVKRVLYTPYNELFKSFRYKP